MKIILRVKTPGIDRLKSRLSYAESNALFKAGEDMSAWFRRYHVRFREKWRGSHYMSGPNSNLFWQRIVAGWQEPKRVGFGKIEIQNTFGLLKWKVTGGSIFPLVAKLLTIPLVSEAKGISAREFSAVESTPLFRAGNVLARRIGKSLEPIYALKDSVHQDPWPGAMPDDAIMREVFATNFRRHLKEELTKS